MAESVPEHERTVTLIASSVLVNCHLTDNGPFKGNQPLVYKVTSLGCV